MSIRKLHAFLSFPPVKVSARTSRLSVKGKFTDAFILKLMLDKISLGVPFNRQCRELDAKGAALNRSTICDQLEISVTALAPIAAAVRDQILAEPFIHADETPHKFQLRNENWYFAGRRSAGSFPCPPSWRQ